MKNEEIDGLLGELAKDIREMDEEIEAMETAYLEQTKQAGNIIRGFENYVNVKLNTRTGSLPKRTKLQPRQMIFSLSSSTSAINEKLKEPIDVKAQNLNGNNSSIQKRQKRKKNYLKFEQGESDRNDGESINNSENIYEDFNEDKGKRRR